MTSTRKLASLATTLLCGVVLAGCMSSGPREVPPPREVAASPFEGDWIGTDGVALSSLRGGKFTSTSLKTGETLTSGTYAMRGANLIDLDFFSQKTGNNTKATCLLANRDQMNCTLASGTQFILSRKMG